MLSSATYDDETRILQHTKHSILQYNYVNAHIRMHHGEDPLVDRVIPESVSSSKILTSQQTGFGTSRPTERSGQLYDPQLVPEIDDDDDKSNGHRDLSVKFIHLPKSVSLQWCNASISSEVISHVCSHFVIAKQRHAFSLQTTNRDYYREKSRKNTP